MNESNFLQLLVVEFSRAEISFMISGSVASGYHGEPRSTYDIDIVIQADLAQTDALVRRLANRCYVSDSAARDAVERKSMFNVIDLETGIKVDLILLKDRPFSVTEFGRRQAATITDVEAFVASAEDCILSKLEWSKMAESDRQYQDALKIAVVLGSKGLDIDYMERWAKELGVGNALRTLRQEAALD